MILNIFDSLFKKKSAKKPTSDSGNVQGLLVGTAIQLANDPENNNRILIKVNYANKAASELWCRVASLDAGDNRGVVFLPEIGDEVILGFIHGDPHQPVVLGMLQSKGDRPPIPANDNNAIKGFTSRNQMHFLFNDENKSITIDTPAGNRILLDEEGKKIEIHDQNNNKMTLNPQGIQIESPKNISIKAGMNLTLNAGSSITIGGSTITVKANGDVSIESATAKIKSSGTTEITGAIVKLN